MERSRKRSISGNSTQVPTKIIKTTQEDITDGLVWQKHEQNLETELSEICCGGYVFYMSDGSPFRRLDVEPVAINGISNKDSVVPSIKKDERKEGSWFEDEEDDSYFDFHVCKEDVTFGTKEQEETSFATVYYNRRHEVSKARFAVSNKCNSWCRLSDTQRNVLTKIQERVDSDRAENRYFTCAIIEGPGGCGKTRLMSHIMNHKQTNSLVLYVTKQNKRVQDFIHTDCLNSELDATVQKPIDLSPMNRHEIKSVIRNNVVGRFALTANKLAVALCGLAPSHFNTENTLSSLGIHCNIFDKESRKRWWAECQNRFEPAVGENSNGGVVVPERNIIVLLDEYTMHEPPLIHAIAHHIMEISRSPLLLIMGGDKLQCGPVGWDGVGKTRPLDERQFSNDVRREIRTKMKYEPLEMPMVDLLRCKGDVALGGCVKRLRRVCEESTNDRHRKAVLNLILARYSVESGVDLYRQEQRSDSVALIRKIVPSNSEVLDFDGSGFMAARRKVKEKPDTEPATQSESISVEEYMRRVDEEEYDEKGVGFDYCLEPPLNPMYDLLPLVKHFATLYTKLAEMSFSNVNESRSQAADVINESAAAIRDLFPIFIALTNKSCNVLAEIFLLSLYTQVRERVLKAPVPDGLRRNENSVQQEETWTKHLKYTLRRLVRSLTIDEKDAVQRQTLFVGMVYKMTSTFRTDGTRCLCNGETVVLNSIEYNNSDLESIDAVILRKLDRAVDTDFELKTGRNKNRMTNEKWVEVMPFVPYVSENIYQMQGNTMPQCATTFIDLVNAPCKNVYVAISRFQNSGSIKGIVISE